MAPKQRRSIGFECGLFVADSTEATQRIAPPVASVSFASAKAQTASFARSISEVL